MTSILKLRIAFSYFYVMHVSSLMTNTERTTFKVVPNFGQYPSVLEKAIYYQLFTFHHIIATFFGFSLGVFEASSFLMDPVLKLNLQ